jgi:hypothetical protein
MKVFLHIGSPKTGTSYIQAVLMHNRERLAEQGLLVPAGRWPEGQVQPVIDLLNSDSEGEVARLARGAWDRFVAEARAHQGEAVILSMEFLVRAQAHHVSRILEDLAGAEVHVVLTARDLGRLMPAIWQETVQNGRTWPWRRFLAACSTEESSTAALLLRRQQHLPSVLRPWQEQIPASRIHVVTVPPSGPPGELWRRFCAVLDLDPDAFDLDVAHVNRSLGATSAELVRRVNKQAGKVDRTTGLMFKHRLAKTVLAARADEPRITVPPRFRPWIRQFSRDMLDELRELDVHVVGSLDDLKPTFPDRTPVPWPDEPAILEAAIDGLVGLSRELGAARTRLAELEGGGVE